MTSGCFYGYLIFIPSLAAENYPVLTAAIHYSGLHQYNFIPAKKVHKKTKELSSSLNGEHEGV